jgi:hypothetical protein
MIKKLKFLLLSPLFYLFPLPVQAQIFGQIQAPAPLQPYNSVGGSGLFVFLNILIKLLMVLAGIFSVFQFLAAGYGFIAAGGDAQKMATAWAKIWQSLLGLVVVASAFVLAGVAGMVIFGSWNALLSPTIYGPN